MYVIVVGGGKVGYYLAKELVDEGQEVLVIEQDAARCQVISEELGDIVLRGDGCEIRVDEQAGMNRADIVIAVTGDDEDNLVTCQIAQHKFGVVRTIARINNPKNEGIFKQLGITTTVSATAAIMSDIEQELPSHQLIPLLRIRGSGLEIVEVKIPQRSPIVGKSIRDLLLPPQSIISLVIDENGTPRVPTNDTVIHAGDEVVAVTLKESEEMLRSALTSEVRR